MAFRDGPFETLKVPLAWTAAAATVAAGVLAFALLLGGRASGDDQAYEALRGGVARTAGPVSGLFAAPVRWIGAASDHVAGYFNAVEENRRLKQQLAELEPWRDQAIALKNVNARYEAMLGLRVEPPVAMATARSVSESRGPFANARLLDAGSSKGVRVGNPVVNEHGLVGRIVGVTPGVSRMVLLTDVASRTPVLIDRTDARAIMTGDGSGNPRLEYMRGAHAIQSGDRILSSGDGGGVPRGVPIGVAARGIDGSWRVKLFSDRGAIDYVRILLFEDFAQLAHREALNAPPLAGLTAAPPVDAATAATISDETVRRAAEAAAAQADARREGGQTQPVPGAQPR
ncbi:MAG: rod shape-determining protein MreC [Brevundimonas sp.]|uniref:rod shape-determining protein MreC n=1 Tax=Brevundimonas sp. TaxID=1871086 RepID=UPI00391DC060